MACRTILRRTAIRSVILYMMVVTDVLSKVVFAFEAIVATISIGLLASYLFIMCSENDFSQVLLKSR